MDNWDRTTLLLARLVCKRWDSLVQDPHFIHKKLEFYSGVKEEFEKNFKTIEDALGALAEKLKTYGDPDLNQIADIMWIVPKEMKEYKLKDSLQEMIGCYHEHSKTWQEYINSRFEREVARAKLVDSTAKMYIHLTETEIAKQVSNNPFEVKVPMDTVLLAPVNKLMSALDVPGNSPPPLASNIDSLLRHRCSAYRR